MLNTWILSKYAVIAYYGAVALVMERWWSALGPDENHNAPTFKKSAPCSIQNRSAPLPLSAHTLIESTGCCHDRSISEPAAIKIIWLRAPVRYYFWRASSGPRAACCRPLMYSDPKKYLDFIVYSVLDVSCKPINTPTYVLTHWHELRITLTKSFLDTFPTY